MVTRVYQPSARSKTSKVFISNGIGCVQDCMRCQAVKKNGQQCTRNTCMVLPYCWQHVKNYGVAVEPTKEPWAGPPPSKKDRPKYPKGLFAVKDFSRGEIITTPEMDASWQLPSDRFHGMYPSADVSNNYAFEDPYRKMVFDPSCSRSAWAYANHRPRSRANAELRRRQNRVVLIALKAIRKGEEIFIDYGYDPTHYEATVVRTRKNVQHSDYFTA